MPAPADNRSTDKALAPRKAEYSRKTLETDVQVGLTFPAGPEAGPEAASVSVDTGVPFFDHLLRSLAFHGRLGLSIRARGDLEVDEHHLVEDTGLVLGEVLARLLEQGPVERFGHAVAPMDEALAEVAVDVCGRPTLVFTGQFPQGRVGSFETDLLREFLKALATRARIALHASLRYGANSHHLAEALFKALGLALRRAYSPAAGGMSTKGTIG
jgi:imidazoleglycerol-phosphate dehydratase